MEIKGSTALVTGASGGLGGAISRELAKRGAHVIVSSRTEALLTELANDINGEVLVADMTSRDDVVKVAERAAGCEIFVINAGVGNDPKLAELTDDEVDFVIDVNLRAPMVMSRRYAVARIEARKPGQLVLVGSLSGLAATTGTRLYNATKFGLRGFTLALHQELEHSGVGCTLVAPGFIREAGMFAKGGVDLPPGVRTKTPQDVAKGVVRAITRNPAEVYVAPVELLAASKFATVAPTISAAVQRRLDVANRVER